jgi:hypothetical protein
MGWASQRAAIGDQMCVFQGSDIIHVLRRQKNDMGEAYELLGGAYLHGYMQGEAVRDKRLSFRPIVLK